MKAQSAYERMLAKVPEQFPGFCWLFEGALDQNGHGNVRFKRGDKWTCAKAHQVSYAHHHNGGELPAKPDVVRHTCHVRNCINPEHLIIGTHGDNMADMVASGRSKNCGKRRASHDAHAACPF
jgi:hypothetical protein